MKKTYNKPTFIAIELNCGAVCQSLVVGSGNTPSTSGDGTDLVKEERTPIADKSVWDNEW